MHPWADYVAVIRAGSDADLIDPDNAGPAVQLALLLGRDDALRPDGPDRRHRLGPRRSRSWPPAAAAIRSSVSAGRPRPRSPTLPVTWYHYPSAMIPFGIAAILRSRRIADEGRGPWRSDRAALVIAAAAIAGRAADLGIAIGLVLPQSSEPT